MAKQKADLRPFNVKRRFSESLIPLVNGKYLIKAARKGNGMIMATNIRCRLPVEGIVRASMATRAPVMYEIAKSEMSYTEFTPASFVEFILQENERLGNTEVPFAIHADHLTVKKPEEIEGVRNLIAAQMEAGFTSFAIDASHMENELNLAATVDLAQPVVQANLSLEVELGEIGAKSGNAEGFTRPDEAQWFVRELVKRSVHPDLLAINNGSKHGNYLEGEKISIDLERTGEIYNAIKEFGVCIAQHGVTGTPLHLIGIFADYGIRKANVGTQWQNVAHAGLPEDLMAEMRAWAAQNKKDVKMAAKPFKDKIDSIPASFQQKIADQAFEEAKVFIQAFRAVGTASRVLEGLTA